MKILHKCHVIKEQQENELKYQNRYAKNHRLTIHDDFRSESRRKEMIYVINIVTILCYIY